MAAADDLDALHARIEAAEAENRELRERLAQIQERRSIVPIPERVTLLSSDGRLEARLARRHLYATETVVCLAANVLFWLSFVSGNPPELTWIFGVGLTLLLVPLGRATVNRVTVAVTGDGIRVAHRPIPSPFQPALRLARADIVELRPTADGLVARDRAGREHVIPAAADEARWLAVEIGERLAP